ncbi:MAG: hypothetical protein Q4A32_06665 [Lachnospiraceae bacterium]|nr:hypothetical protein [Lachnospiraceae bacterium]
MVNVLCGSEGVYRSILLMGTVRENMRVAMLCFGAGLMFIFYGRYVWKYNKPDHIPGYTKREYEDTHTFSRMAGQAHILVGVGLLLLSFPLNELTPNPVFAIAALAGCLVMVALGVVRYVQAIKSRRR